LNLVKISNVFSRACKSKNIAVNLSVFVEKMMTLGKKQVFLVINEDKITYPLTMEKGQFEFIFVAL